MLVEDDKSLREIYSIRLVAEGYNIVSAGDGEEALALAAQEKPDLIISDVMMPKISGFDMLDILRSQPETKDIKVIMMTALSSEDQRQRGETLGADRYLVKSQVGIEDVVNTVHEVLGDQPNASAHTSMSTAAVMPAVEQAAKEAEAAEAPVNIDAPTTAETTIAPQNSSTPAPDVNQQMQTAIPEAPAAPATPAAPQAPTAPQSMIPEPPAPQGPPGGNPANFNQAPVAYPAVVTMQPAAGANPQMPVNQARKSTGGERIIAPLDDPAAFERRRQSNERLMEELLNEGQPAPRSAGEAYSAPQAPADSVPNPQLANNPAMTATGQQFAAQAIANQANNAAPVTIPPKQPNITLSAALQGSAQPSQPKPGSTATMPGQPTPPPAMPMPPQMPPTPQQPAPTPQQPAPTPQQLAPQAQNATPNNSPQQASPQVAQPAPTPQQPAPQQVAAKPASKKNPVNNMSPEMIAQVVQATKVNTVHDEDEVIEAIKPAYISELEEDLSADMNDLDGAKNTMAARMFNELKDDEITIAASQMERPVIKEAAEIEEPEVELPDVLKDALTHTDEQNPNINYSTGEEGEDEDFDNGAVTIVQSDSPAISDDGMGPANPEMVVESK